MYRIRGPVVEAPHAREYSRDAYCRLIGSLVDEGVRFASFSEGRSGGARTIYLRHDVDYSLELAVELAELNNEMGMCGTFFVQVRAAFYNVFHTQEAARVRRLLALGQRVALHYTPLCGDWADAVDPEAVATDFELLGQIDARLDRAISWHRPSAEFLARRGIEVPGFVNVYGERFFRSMPYLSDSTHRHSVDGLATLLRTREAPELHLLLHPINWIAGGSSGAEILLRGWTRILRDHDRTLLENRAYHARFPNGMPEDLLARFERDLLRAAAS